MGKMKIRLSKWSKMNDVNLNTARVWFHKGQIDNSFQDERGGIWVEIDNPKTVVYTTSLDIDDKELQTFNYDSYIVGDFDNGRLLKVLRDKDLSSLILVEMSDKLSVLEMSLIEQYCEEKKVKLTIL